MVACTCDGVRRGRAMATVMPMVPSVCKIGQAMGWRGGVEDFAVLFSRFHLSETERDIHVCRWTPTVRARCVPRLVERRAPLFAPGQMVEEGVHGVVCLSVGTTSGRCVLGGMRCARDSTLRRRWVV